MNVRFGRCFICRRFSVLHRHIVYWLCPLDLAAVTSGWEER